MNARRRRLVLGTERIWSIWVWTLGLAFGTLFAFGLARITDGMGPPPMPTEPTALSRWLSENRVVIAVLLALVAALILRFHVWPPLAKLYNVAPRPEVFWGHCRALGIRALPYALVLAVAIALLVVPLEGYLIVAQVALIFVVDHLIDRRRDRFIAREMPGFLPNGPDWPDW